MREIPLYTLAGVPDAVATVHPFSTEDKLGLTLTRFSRGNRHRDAVLLLHGLPYNASGTDYNLDDVALYDHPATVDEVRKHIGERPLHVISHCLGVAEEARSALTRLLAGGYGPPTDSGEEPSL